MVVISWRVGTLPSQGPLDALGLQYKYPQGMLRVASPRTHSSTEGQAKADPGTAWLLVDQWSITGLHLETIKYSAFKKLFCNHQAFCASCEEIKTFCYSLFSASILKGKTLTSVLHCLPVFCHLLIAITVNMILKMPYTQKYVCLFSYKSISCTSRRIYRFLWYTFFW